MLEGLITSFSLLETFVKIWPEPQRSWWPHGFLTCLCPRSWAARDPRPGGRVSRASSTVLCRARFGASGQVCWVSDLSMEAAAVAMPFLGSGRASESNHEARTVAQTPAVKTPVESLSPSIFSCIARTGIAAGQSGMCLLVGQRSPPERDHRGPSPIATPSPWCCRGEASAMPWWWRAGLSAREGW